MFVEKLPAHPEYTKAAPVDKATNKKVNPNKKKKLERREDPIGAIGNWKSGNQGHPLKIRLFANLQIILKS